uniref:PyrB protein n=1 Tax=Fopius arisanus TaxID=64838 RepID=A0A0C9R6B4_9HYME
MAKDKTVKIRKKSKKMACCGCTRNRNSDVFCEDPMLSDQQQYRYMTVDDMKSMGDDSMRVNVTDDEKDNRHSGGVSVTDMVTKETYQRTNAANLKPDNVDIHRHPVHVGYVFNFFFHIQYNNEFKEMINPCTYLRINKFENFEEHQMIICKDVTMELDKTRNNILCIIE